MSTSTLDEEPKIESNEAYYQQLLLFLMEDKLMMIDIVKDGYYELNQYYFLKIIFDQM